VFFRILPLILASLLMGAHFLRSGNLLLVILFLAAPLLLLIRRRWVLNVLQVICYLEVLIWLQTALNIIWERISYGEAWLRVAFILAPVALLALVAGLLLRSPALKESYPTTARISSAQ
jgi:hypothetical protein